MSLSPENAGAVCEVCQVSATVQTSTVESAKRNPVLDKQRFLCTTHWPWWSNYRHYFHNWVQSGTRINSKRWQQVFDAFVLEARNGGYKGEKKEGQYDDQE